MFVSIIEARVRILVIIVKIVITFSSLALVLVLVLLKPGILNFKGIFNDIITIRSSKISIR